MIKEEVASLITIKGKFYDSFLYEGILYLVDQNAKIIPLKWNKFIDRISKNNETNRLAILSAFCNADWLYYRKHSGHLFDDNDIVNLIINKFRKINGKHFIFSLDDIKEFLFNEKYWYQLKELPTQILLTYNHLFILFDDSFEYMKINNNKMHIFSELKTIVENHRFVSMEYVTGGIVLAEQDKGCYLMDLPEEFNYSGFDEGCPDLISISNSHASYITRNYSSFLIGSYCSKSNFCFRSNPFRHEENGKSEIAINELTDSGKFSFSNADKIYELYDGYIISKKFIQKNENKITTLGRTEITTSDQTIISARGTWFGVVLELKDRIELVFSNGLSKTIHFNEGDLINWEIFPNSNQYGNQLHLIFKDKIDIYSFNSDIFVPQKDKLIGSYFFEKTNKRNF